MNGSSRRVVRDVAKNRRKKRGWLRAVLLFVFIPLFIWAAAFIAWFYWKDITGLFHSDKGSSSAKPSKQFAKPNKQIDKPPEEKILDEERKKLDEILKRR